MKITTEELLSPGPQEDHIDNNLPKMIQQVMHPNIMIQLLIYIICMAKLNTFPEVNLVKGTIELMIKLAETIKHNQTNTEERVLLMSRLSDKVLKS